MELFCLPTPFQRIPFRRICNPTGKGRINRRQITNLPEQKEQTNQNKRVVNDNDGVLQGVSSAERRRSSDAVVTEGKAPEMDGELTEQTAAVVRVELRVEGKQHGQLIRQVIQGIIQELPLLFGCH